MAAATTTMPDTAPLPEQVYLASVVEQVYTGCFVGTLIAMALYGVTLQQMYHYWRTYKRDATWTKLTVLAVLLIETANVVLNVYFLYNALVSQFGFVQTVLYPGGVFAANQALFGATAVIVQLFFAWRVFVLSRHYILPSLITIFAFVGLGGCLAVTVMVSRLQWAEFGKLELEAYIWAIANVAADVTITLAMVWTLTRRKTGFQRSDDEVDKIVVLTLESGALVTTWAIIDLALYASQGTRNSSHLAFQFTISKLYALSLMATLNSRKAAATPNATTHRDAPVASVALNEARKRSVATTVGESTMRDSASINIVGEPDFEEISLTQNPFRLAGAGDDVEKRGRNSLTFL